MSEQDDKPPTSESSDSSTDNATKQEDEAPPPAEPTEEEGGEEVSQQNEQEEQNQQGEQESNDEETAPPLPEGTEVDEQAGEEVPEVAEAANVDTEDVDTSAAEGADTQGTDTDTAGEGGEHPFSPDLERHVFEGEFNAHGNPVGYHHREGGVDEGDFKVDDATKSPVDQHGVYEADWTGTAPDGTEATKNSSFFPDSYSKEDVRDAVREAFDNRTSPSPSNPRLWEGTTSDGMTIQGYVGPGTTVADATEDDIRTAFPVWQGRFLL